MSFKFVRERDSDTLHTYNKWEDILDPSVNKFYYVQRNKLKVRQAKLLLEALYNRSNLLAADSPYIEFQLHRFSPEKKEAVNVLLRNMITKVNPEALWVLGFVFVIPYEIGRLYLQYYENTGSLYPITASVKELRFRTGETIITFRNRVNVPGNSARYEPLTGGSLEEQGQTIADIVNRIALTWNTTFQNEADAYLHISYAPVDALGAAIWKMASGESYCRISGSGRVSANDVLSQLSLGGKIKAEFRDGDLRIDCRILAHDSNRVPLFNRLSYSTNIMSLMENTFIKLNHEQNPIFYGVELEVSTSYNVRELIEAQHKLFFACKEDSSISGSHPNRAELVTVPMSFKAQKLYWAKFFSKLDYDKFDTSRKTTNGMHVHIGHKHFADKGHVARLSWFINNPSNYQFLFAISERETSSLQNYAAIPQIEGSRLTKVGAIKETVFLSGRHRGALNVGSDKGTIEVRLFKGIVSYACVVKNLEFVDALMAFTQEATSQLQMTVNTFVKWLDRTDVNRYPVLKKFIKSISNIDDILKIAPIHDSIINIQDPQKVCDLVNKKGLQKDNVIISWLNKKVGKRTYILDKATGKLITERPLGSKIASMDRDLEARYSRTI